MSEEIYHNLDAEKVIDTIEKISVTAFVQVLESGLNDVILIGAGIFFLAKLKH